MAVYAHPIEHIISNIFPVTLGLALLKAPMSTAWVVFTTTQLATLGDHSGLNLKFKKIILVAIMNFVGYHLPFLHSPQVRKFSKIQIIFKLIFF